MEVFVCAHACIPFYVSSYDARDQPPTTSSGYQLQDLSHPPEDPDPSPHHPDLPSDDLSFRPDDLGFRSDDLGGLTSVSDPQPPSLTSVADPVNFATPQSSESVPLVSGSDLYSVSGGSGEEQLHLYWLGAAAAALCLLLLLLTAAVYLVRWRAVARKRGQFYSKLTFLKKTIYAQAVCGWGTKILNSKMVLAREVYFL